MTETRQLSGGQGVLDLLAPEATISEDGAYRYDLSRTWDPGKLTVCWVMLNPSTADALTDDPTIRRVRGFSQRDGWFGKLVVVNVFAYRATSPGELKDVRDATGEHNDSYLRAHIRTSNMVVAAWGASMPRRHGGQEPWVARMLPGGRTVCLGTTKDGRPRHPLYVKADQQWEPFDMKALWYQ